MKFKNGAKYIKLHSAFTLIEVLMVTGIMGILVTIVAFVYPASQKRARDTSRLSDLKQWQTSLESYANRNNGIYPAFITTEQPNGSSLCALLYPEYPPCPGPADPRAGETATCSSYTCNYQYISNAGGTMYVLFSPLEAPSDTTKPYFIICSAGVTGYGAAGSTDGTCPL